MTVREALNALVAGRSLAVGEAETLFGDALGGDVTAAQLGAILIALRMKGEHADELVGAAQALRRRAVAVPGVPAGAVDTCGTGGDGARTFNVSTAAALVVAASGVPVAKHGNRAVSSAVGSADVLEALGVAIDLAPARLGACVREVGIAFLYAPALHPALGRVGPTRRELGVRTIFNLLGPLVNPARVRRQVVGVPEERWLAPMAAALGRLGSEHAWVVHGEGGLDELSVAGRSLIARVRHGEVVMDEVQPAALGLRGGPIDALVVGSAAESAACIRAVLDGAPGPARDVVLLNAAAAIVVGGAAPDLAAGIARAAASVDTGAARRTLDRLRAFTQAGDAP